MTHQQDLYLELISSQIPALQLLIALGYNYFTPSEALAARDGKTSNIIFSHILKAQLQRLNRITYKGQQYPFSENNINEAIRQLNTHIAEEGLLTVNQKLYEQLTLGLSLPQTIQGDKKSHTIHYIDWQNPRNNLFHVTEEFSVEKTGSHSTRRADIVCFVNGIPLVIIECKSPTLQSGNKPVVEAIKQLLMYQNKEEIPTLFFHSQLLLAISQNDARYATTATEPKFWALWQEEEKRENHPTTSPPPPTPSQHTPPKKGTFKNTLATLINTPLSQRHQDHLYNHRPQSETIKKHFQQLKTRQISPQDQAIYSLLQPERLLDLSKNFIVFDKNTKKIARYQQYFAVKQSINRIAHLNHQKQRTGGVIWHTTGSGKSITMVLLAKAIAQHPNITTPRLIIVTDRIDLDDQISNTFNACGKKSAKAKSGSHLINLIQSRKADVITTVINKFETVAKENITINNPNIFILVDESHRSQYGSIQAKMRQVFRKACYIGFTGTPLIKKDKQTTVQKFGSFIHTYSMRRAVADQAVVPLLYEGRLVPQDINQQAIDDFFEKITRPLSQKQQLDLKRKFSRSEQINRTEQRLRIIALDISEHYRRQFQGDGFKAQLAAPSKRIALKYKKLLDEIGIINSAIIISPPDSKEGEDKQADNAKNVELKAFWQNMMQTYKSETAYNKEIKKDFSKKDGVELLIVVDKLLTGFDEPRNTVLYIDKPLKEHSLLQAIARVNRLFKNKSNGYIIDYRGVLGDLNEAMETYTALEAYDPEDIKDSFNDISTEIAKLPQHHTDLWAIFNPVANPNDIEAMQQFLEPEDRRYKFYQALTTFSNCLKIALSAVSFYNNTPPAKINAYKNDLHYFHKLRSAVRNRYAESINYSKDYEAKVRKLMDEHIKANKVQTITQVVNIFNTEQFDAEVAQLGNSRAKADTIAYRVKQTAIENMDQDPAFYKNFSRLIDEAIEAYRVGRLTDAQYLQRVTEAMHQMRQGHSDDRPARLHHYTHAPAYYNNIKEPIQQYTQSHPTLNTAAMDEIIADVAIHLEGLIEKNKIRDWTRNLDIQRQIKNAIEDYLFSIQNKYAIPLSYDDIDLISENIVELAKQREQ